MESNEAVDQLRQMERSEAAGWVDVPPTPWWVPLYFGAYGALLAWSIGALDGWLASLVQLGLVASAGAMVWWQRRVRGTWPTSSPPRELRRPLLILALGAVAVLLVSWGAHAIAGLPAAVVIAGLGTTLVSWSYERDYARAAADAQRRLA